MRCEIKYSLDVYLLADAVSMVAMGITVSGEAEVEIPEIDFFFFECFGFLVISIFVWLYMLIAKKQYLSLALLVGGIALLGVSEIFNA